MSKLTEEYDKVKKQIEENNKELEQLVATSKDVKKYLELTFENNDLNAEKDILFPDVQKEKYDSCAHILVYTKIEHDRVEGRTYKSCGCIKCGLDNSVLDFNRDYLYLNEKIMYDYLESRKSEHSSFEGISGKNLEISCDLDLAQAIYAKIKGAHPDIDDETAIKYFEISLENIRNISVNEERKISRARRLSLSKNFKRWNASDVHQG